MNKTWKNTGILTSLLLILLGFGCVFSLGVGTSPISPGEVWRAIIDADTSRATDVIVRDIRLPRLVLAVLIGASLSVAGAAMQGFFQNPMADPYIVGVSSGAAFGATLGMVLHLDF